MIQDGFYKTAALAAHQLPGKAHTIPVMLKQRSILSEYAGPFLSPRDNTVEVKKGVAHFLDLESMKSFAEPFFKGTIFKEVIEHLDWPSDAVFKVSYAVKCWPGEYTQNTIYFTDREQMDAWLVDHHKWARLEGNSFQMNAIYEWDLGPSLIA